MASHVKSAWEGAYGDLKCLCAKIDSGHIKLLDVDELQARHFDNDFSKFCAEINYLCQYFRVDSHEQRIQQLRLYDKFRSSYEAAVEIEKIRVELQLESHFDELADLLRIKTSEFREWDLVKMDAHIERVVHGLEGVNHPNKIECLAAFAKCRELVEWLRKFAPDHFQLKTLVDMVSSNSTYESMSNHSKLAFLNNIYCILSCFAYNKNFFCL